MSAQGELTRVYVGLGSNRGDRLEFLDRAVAELGAVEETRIGPCSSVYETEPVGVKEQREFLNMVVGLAMPVSPHHLYETMKAIELKIGRVSSTRWGPREIDLDILYFGGRILKTSGLEIPHAEVARRRFVLEPMAEIAPDFVDPVRMLTIRQLLAACPDTSAVRKTALRLHSTTAVKVP